MSGIRRAVIALSAVRLAVVAPASALASALAATSDDPALVDDLQWALERIGALDAWDRGTGDGVTIAVVDSGVDLTHEDLADKVEAHVSCIGAGGDPTKCQGSAPDDNGHGTPVSGVAPAVTANRPGVAGGAPAGRPLAGGVRWGAAGGGVRM